jgi:succinate dehydrogenase / fumarate reductase cytochrome b subunit
MLYCLFYFLGSLAIPGAILSGVVKPAQGTAAANPQYAAHACCETK